MSSLESEFESLKVHVVEALIARCDPAINATLDYFYECFDLTALDVSINFSAVIAAVKLGFCDNNLADSLNPILESKGMPLVPKTGHMHELWCKFTHAANIFSVLAERLTDEDSMSTTWKHWLVPPSLTASTGAQADDIDWDDTDGDEESNCDDQPLGRLPHWVPTEWDFHALHIIHRMLYPGSKGLTEEDRQTIYGGPFRWVMEGTAPNQFWTDAELDNPSWTEKHMPSGSLLKEEAPFGFGHYSQANIWLSWYLARSHALQIQTPPSQRWLKRRKLLDEVEVLKEVHAELCSLRDSVSELRATLPDREAIRKLTAELRSRKRPSG